MLDCLSNVSGIMDGIVSVKVMRSASIVTDTCIGYGSFFFSSISDCTNIGDSVILLLAEEH